MELKFYQVELLKHKQYLKDFVVCDNTEQLNNHIRNRLKDGYTLKRSVPVEGEVFMLTKRLQEAEEPSKKKKSKK